MEIVFFRNNVKSWKRVGALIEMMKSNDKQKRQLETYDETNNWFKW